MIRLATITVLVGLSAAWPEASAEAAETVRCLSARATREAVAAGRAISLAEIKRTVEQRSGSEVLRARLCDRDGQLIYTLTILRHGGQVVAMTVNAADGSEGPPSPRPTPPRAPGRDTAARGG